MADLDRVGGLPVLMQELLEAGLLHGDAITVTGRTVAENLADAGAAGPTATSCGPVGEPIHPYGGIAILRGSLAPDGSVGKIVGMEGCTFPGVGARVRLGGGRVRGGDRRADRDRRRDRDPVRGTEGRAGHARDARRDRRGARGRPGRRRRCWSPTGGSPARRTGSHRPLAPEAAVGGPIALVRTATRSRSTWTPGAWTWRSRRPSWTAAATAGRRRSRGTSTARWRSTRGWCPPRARRGLRLGLECVSLIVATFDFARSHRGFAESALQRNRFEGCRTLRVRSLHE